MKKYLFLLLLCIPFWVGAQTKADSTQVKSTRVQSVVIQKTDSLNLERLNRVEISITKFHNAMRTSQFFTIFGSALVTLAMLNANSSSYGFSNTLVLAGLGSSLVGGVLYLDSYKYLNIRKKSPAVRRNELDYY